MFLKYKVAFLILVCLAGQLLVKSNEINKIGIIGGGIGGTSCAYFLKNLLQEYNIEIDLYEAEKIGGRLSVVNISEYLYEEGGNIIHSHNKYMTKFLKRFKLSKKRDKFKRYSGLSDGKNFVISENDSILKTNWKIIWRYGWKFWKLMIYIKSALKRFEKIYDLQGQKKSYETLESMLHEIDPTFVGKTHTSIKKGFRKLGFSDSIINEIILATMLSAYGQNLNAHQLAGITSILGHSANLWRVHGGNYLVPEHLLKESKANLIQQRVKTVKRLSSGKFEIIPGNSPTSSGGKKSNIYDVVVLAAPQHRNAKYPINFENFKKEIAFRVKYHKTVCTLVEGTLNENFFRNKDPLIDQIFIFKEGLFFNSLEHITPVDFEPDCLNDTKVWKIYSQKKLKQCEIAALFLDVKSKHVREWFAYPQYDVRSCPENHSFVLDSNLYYINAVEWIGSAMEVSVIGAKNVALLIFNNYCPCDISNDLENKTIAPPKSENCSDETHDHEEL